MIVSRQRCAATAHGNAVDTSNIQCSMMPDDDQIELLRSVLSHAYEKRQPFLLRLVQAAKDYVGHPRTLRKPIIESLNIIEKNKNVA
jgi:hypothetical protein